MAKVAISNYFSQSAKLDRDYRIVQVSDYHSNDKIEFVEEIVALKPDFIVITGDLVDRRRYNLMVAEKLIRKLVTITQVIYISGNHEIWSNKYDDVKIMLKRYDVIILDNFNYSVGNLNFIGLIDPSTNYLDGEKVRYLKDEDQYLAKLIVKSKYNLLLVHRPEFFKEYVKHDVDLILCGHAHGGQFRFFNQAIYAPNQGLFPKYSNGEYLSNSSKMIVSSGLGNSRFPIRLFNNFELVVIDLLKIG